MNKGVKIALAVITVVAFALFAVINLYTRKLAIDVITLAPEEKPKLLKTPADYGMNYETVTVTTEDDLELKGWFVPSKNRAVIMLLHAAAEGRQGVLDESEFLNRHGYGVLLPSFRAHDDSEGEIVTFGYHEQKDLAAWTTYLLSRDDPQKTKIGVLGESTGAATAIMFAAEHDAVQALVSVGAYTRLMQDTDVVDCYICVVPEWLTAVLHPFIIFWAEREGDFEANELDPAAVIGDISPRPILIIHGGKDDKASPENGHELYAAAGEPKELAFFEDCGHVNFDTCVPKEYEEAVAGFFDRYLLIDS